MKRYAVSQVIGDGLTDDTAFRPACAMIPNLSWAVLIAPDFETNPNKRWTLCVVAATEQTLAQADAMPDIDVLSFGPEHNANPWVSIGTQQYRQQVANAVQSRTGYTILRDDPRTIGEVVTGLGQTLDPNYNENGMNIIDNY